MLSSNTKDHRQRKLCCWNPIQESNLIFQRANQIFVLLIHYIFCNHLLLSGELTMKPINITGMVLMCREICKQAIGFVFCYMNTSASFCQGFLKKAYKLLILFLNNLLSTSPKHKCIIQNSKRKKKIPAEEFKILKADLLR